MDGLIFFAVIIFFSIIESISRSRKAQRKREGEGPAEPELFEWAQTPQERADLPTYDDDRSYDEAHEGDDDDPREPAPDGVGMTGAEVAADIWAEIRALGLGAIEERTEPTPSIPRQSPPLPVPLRPAESARTPRPAPLPRPLPKPSAKEEGRASAREGRGAPRPHQEHRAHRAHEDYGTDPSERAPSEQDGLDPLAEHLGADAAAVRAQLRSHDASALRRAIILQEVLGPPAVLRRDRFED